MEKKHLFIIIALLAIAFGSYIYNYPPVNGTTNSAVRSLLADNSTIKPSTLRVSLIREMVENYRQTQLRAIENAGQDAVKDDSRSILFDLHTLKNFLNAIESATKQNDAHAKLGIRMYYAAYPLNSKWGEPGYKDLKRLLDDEITKQYERKHTLILIPVIKNNKGIYADFNPLDKSTYQGFPKRLNTGMRLLSEPPADTTDIPGLNHGQLIPPASNQGEGF